jgi:hypothetical protein
VIRSPPSFIGIIPLFPTALSSRNGFSPKYRARTLNCGFVGAHRKSETFMRTIELFRTCGNEHVAAAALACIGGKLQRRVAEAAKNGGLSSGAMVARLVAEYDRKAGPARRKILETGMVQNEMPILAGLRHVVETALEGAWDASRDVARTAKAGLDERRLLRWEAGPRGLLRGEPELKSLCN